MASGHGIVILDFGGQYTQLIARRVREHHVHSTIVRYDIGAEELRRLAPAGIVLSGGPSSVFDEDSPHSDPAILEMGIPVLGICYGLQLIAQQLGGEVRPAPNREYGRALLEIAEGSRLLKSLPASLPVWNSHGDEVIELPRGRGPAHLCGELKVRVPRYRKPVPLRSEHSAASYSGESGNLHGCAYCQPGVAPHRQDHFSRHQTL